MGGTLIVDLSSILGETGTTMDVDGDVPLESMIVGDVEIDFSAAPSIRVTITNAGEVILLTGSVQATARLECARCLEPFDFPLTGAIDAVISVTDDAEQRGEEQEWYPLDGETVDLLPAAESALRVEVPFAPVHDEECHGICPTCGCDLNRDTCTCERQAEGSENPFASLRELLPPEDD
jgi:uncharacterized protein